MRGRLVTRVAVVAALVCGSVAGFGGGVASSAPAANDQDVIPGAWIVEVERGASGRQVAAEHARDHGAQVDHIYEHALNGYAARMSSTAAARVQRDPRVVRVEADRVVRAFAQTVPTGVDRIDGETSSAASGDGTGSVAVDIAIIDTGIDVDHPDLNVVGGKNCSRGSSYDDGNGHGTHVAGTAAAKDDSNGVVGVAPGARLWAVRVLDNSGSGSWSSVQCGIDWVTGHGGIEVANMSLGGSSSEDDSSCSKTTLHQAICNSVSSGTTYAVAAGNSAADAKNYVPAKYDQVITVSALADFDGVTGGVGSPTCRTDEDDTLASFSNYGADVDVIAPGVCIHSTWKGGGYNTISGTSMASPHVAGAAALYKASNPGASPAQVQAALQNGGHTDWSNSDDGDSTKEPLLYVGDGTSTTAPGNTAPSVSITQPADGTSVAEGDTVTLTGAASDTEQGDLSSSIAWSSDLQGGLGTGATIAPTLTAGTHTITASVTDSGGLTGSASITVTVTSSSSGSLALDDAISHTLFGGKTNNNHVDLTVTLSGSAPVGGVAVTVEIYRNGGTSPWATYSGTTGSDGRLTFGYRGIPSGSYVAEITNVSSSYWDSIGDTTSWSK